MTPKEWIERIENVMRVQKETGLMTMSMRFTREELAELRMMCECVSEMGERK